MSNQTQVFSVRDTKQCLSLSSDNHENSDPHQRSFPATYVKKIRRRSNRYKRANEKLVSLT